MKIKLLLQVVIISVVSVAFGLENVFAQAPKPQPAGQFNPLVPGYFADPSIKKFGDTYYCYATSDGVKEGYGAPQVWISKDFVNWYNYKMELPQATENVWAPDVVVGPDNRYYYYYCSCQEGCAIYGYVSDSPIGPWQKLHEDNSPVVPVDYAKPVITLDGHVFKDDDGSYWMYFCTWAIYPGNGMGWAKLNPDMKSFSSKGLIPNTQLKDVFEAPFMLKKDGKYYATYSSGDCHEDSYRVQYGIGNSPNGNFTFGPNNPILSTNADGTVHGPGHHSILQEKEAYYMIYHRHDNPHSTGGMLRQLAADRMTFDSNGAIEKVKPSHTGLGYLGSNQIPQPDVAYQQKATASSYYKDVVNHYEYSPSLAVDNNNGTQWKAGTMEMGQWLQIDLGKVQTVKRVLTNFEYSVYYYQYKIEYSANGKTWSLYADRTANRRPGSPMVDDGNANARYLRLTITGVEKPGLFPAIWNVKAYNAISPTFNPLQNPESSESPAVFTRGNKLLDIDAASLTAGTIENIANKGTLGGTFTKTGNPKVETIAGRQAITFGGADYFTFDQKAPNSLSWNSSFTVAAWVYNPSISESECIVSWARRGGPMSTYAALNYGTSPGWGAVAHWQYADMGYEGGVPSAGAWHYVVVTFDGMVEKVYVDGKLNAQEQKNLYVYPNDPIYLGWSTDDSEFLTGSIASLQLYDYALDQTAITHLQSGKKTQNP